MPATSILKRLCLPSTRFAAHSTARFRRRSSSSLRGSSMWWLEPRSPRCVALRLGLRIGLRIVGVCAAAVPLASCFQPLYGDVSFTSSPSVAAAMATVDVNQIAAANGTPLSRIAVEVRNKLLFHLTGGGAAAPPAYRVNITLTASKLSTIVHINRGR